MIPETFRLALPLCALLVAGCGSDTGLADVAPSDPPEQAWDSAWTLYQRTPHDSLSMETPASRFAWFEATYPTSSQADDAHWWFGYTRYLQGRWSEAQAILLALPGHHPSSVRIDNALHYAARCMVESALFPAARDSIRHFLSDPRFSASVYRPDAWHYLGRALQGLDSNAAARSAFQVVLDSFPTDTLRGAEAAYQIGRTWYADSSWLAAQGWFGRIATAYPTAVSRQDNALYWLSRCQHRRGLEDSGIAGYRALLLRFPASTFADQAAYQVGAAFQDRAFRIGSATLYDSAIAAEDAFLANWPSSAYRDDAVYEQGKCLYRKKQPVPAEALMDSVVAWSPHSNVRDYALYYAARIRSDAGDCAGAAGVFATLLADHPASPAIALARSHAASNGCALP